MTATISDDLEVRPAKSVLTEFTSASLPLWQVFLVALAVQVVLIAAGRFDALLAAASVGAVGACWLVAFFLKIRLGDEWDGYSLGVLPEGLLKPAVEAEVARSRRYGHEFALVLADYGDLQRKFILRRSRDRKEAMLNGARLFTQTRTGVDLVFRYGSHGFAILLPESGSDTVQGMVMRLRRLSGAASGEDSIAHLPFYFGATFFPSSATEPAKLMQRGKLSIRVAHSSPSRVHLDGARAADAAEPDTLRAAV